MSSQDQSKSGVKKAVDDVKATFEHHIAAPGPVMPQNFNIKEEGTKEERRAKADALNRTEGPGPVIPQSFDVKEEGTKEERRAKAEALNK